MEFIALLGITIILISLGLLALGVRILFHRSHKFPETSAGHNPEVRKRGISCPKHEETMMWGRGARRRACSTCFEHARE